MGKKMVVAAMAAVLALMLVGCGGSSTSSSSATSSSSSSSSASQSKNLGDSVTMHEVYCTEKGDTYVDYQIVYYTASSHTLKALASLTHFDKVEGLTLDYLEGYDFDSIYPNFSKLSFASKGIYDDGDYFTVFARFDDLDVKGNLQQLHDNGILELVDRNSESVSADSLINIMEKAGAQKISIAEYEKLGLTKYL